MSLYGTHSNTELHSKLSFNVDAQTVQQLKPEFVDVTEIKRNGYFAGYQKNSFVRELLVEQLNIDESKLKAYRTPEEYDEALSNGSDNGGVAVIVDEIPYIKLFLLKYGSRYAMVGSIYKTDGFGFVSIFLSLPPCQHKRVIQECKLLSL